MSEATARRIWSWRELHWALAWSLALAVLTTLPYVYGGGRSKPNESYLGFVFNPDEPNVHLSWIRQCRDGAVFVRNEFTSEPHEGRFLNLFMIVGGRLADWFGRTPYQVWCGLRLLAVVLFGLVLYVAVSDLISRPGWRRFAVACVCLSSGLGWWVSGSGLAVDTIDLEPDLVMPEAITFLSLYLNPLFNVSMALLVGAMVAGARAIRHGDRRPAWLAGAAGLVLANVHTYDFIPLALVLTTYAAILCWRDRRLSAARLAPLAIVIGLSLPAVVYQAALIRSDPLYAAKANTPTLTPALPAMLLSYGLLVPLAIVGAVTWLRRRRPAMLFWAIWLVVHGLCLYLPASLFPFQRKMAEGLHVPLAVLAAVGLIELGRKFGGALAAWQAYGRLRDQGPAWPMLVGLAERRRAVAGPVMALGLLALIPSTVLFVQSTLDALDQNNQAKRHMFMPPFRIPKVDYEGLRWLRDDADAPGAVLCLPRTGSYIPGLIGRTVYIGHWAETIQFAEKLRETARFFRDAGTAADKTRFLWDNGIGYVFYGTDEQAATGGLIPLLPALEQVYPPGGSPTAPVRIFRVRPAAELPEPPPLPAG